MSRWKTSDTAVYNLSYHIVWCPKYHRAVLADKIAERLAELLNQKVKELQIEIVETNIMSDHVHLCLLEQNLYTRHNLL